MSWSQDYQVPGYLDLLLQLTEKDQSAFVEYLEADLRDRLGISIAKREDIVLDDGLYEEIHGTKVTLSDGRVFVPKLIERFTENGNYGLDTYQYFPDSETPNVSYTGLDHAEEGADQTVISDPEDYIDVLEQGEIEC